MESAFSLRTWNCEYTSGRGGRREDAPLLFKGYNQSSFWLLNCELWPYIIFFWLFLKTLVAGKVHSLLINILFITAQEQYLLSRCFFFNVDHFELLAIKSMKIEAMASSPSSCVALRRHSLSTQAVFTYITPGRSLHFLVMLSRKAVFKVIVATMDFLSGPNLTV